MGKVVSYGKISIAYSVRKSARKTIGIEVHPNASVEVVAPFSASEQLIHSKVEKRAAWITKQIRFFEAGHKAERKQEWVSGEAIYYLGRQYRLKVLSGEDEEVKLAGRFLIVTLANRQNAAQVRAMVDGWMLNQAKLVFPKRVERYSSLLAKEKIRMNKLMIRKIQKRWGSCTKKGNIVLNSELIHSSVLCIDYVIIHEMCHLKHHHHGPKFWSMLAKYCPDWVKRKEKLDKLNY